MRKILFGFLLTASAYWLSSTSTPPEQMQVGVSYDKGLLVTTNQLLNPAGARIQFPGRPLDIAVSPSGDTIAVLVSGALRLYTPAGQLIRTISIGPSAGGLAFVPRRGGILVSQLNTNGAHGIAVLDPSGAAAPGWIPLPAYSGPAGIAVDADGAFAYIALNLRNAVAKVDLASFKSSMITVGVAPFALALTPDGASLFVANQGGAPPADGEATAASSGTPILIDQNGAARSGTMSVIDTAKFVRLADVATGLLPGSVRVSPDGLYAAVANGNSDSVTFFSVRTLQPVLTVQIPALPAGSGSGPTALAFDATGGRLYVACGGNNTVAVLTRSFAAPHLRRRRLPEYSVAGVFPTDWYPIAVAAAPDGAVFVANSKGIGARSGNPPFRVSSWLGTMNIVQPSVTLRTFTQSGSGENDPFRNAPIPSGSPADLHSLGIDHVFFIIKENRTYDQVLGDIGMGNSSPDLAIYGAAVTPNHHALATQFVLLDNFYAAGTVSPDGHQWLTQSIVTPYLERAYPTFFRSYPAEGEDPLALAPTGFLWTNAQAHGLSVRVYGEYTAPSGSYSFAWSRYLQDAAGPMQTVTRSDSPIRALSPLVEHEYPAFALNVPDVYRARKFLDRFRDFEAQGTLPNLVIIQLASDHTLGVTPGAPAPEAMLADNDLALGQVVEAISSSSYWPSSAIFITEDDAQDGVDHVDGHRTLCLVVSPYTRRRVVDSTHYNQISVLRTIEDLLGLPPMTKFDAAALPMRSVFSTGRDLTPFRSLPANIPLDRTTPALSALSGSLRRAAIRSLGMNFSAPDAAPEEELNRILWHAARGWQTRYPSVPHSPSCPPE